MCMAMRGAATGLLQITPTETLGVLYTLHAYTDWCKEMSVVSSVPKSKNSRT